MSKVTIKLNSDGIKALLKSSEVLSMVESKAQERAGSDTHIKSFIGFDRAHAVIYPDTKEYK